MSGFLLASVTMSAMPVIGLVVAVVIIRGPARWTAGVGLLLMAGTSALSVLLPWVAAESGAPAALLLSLWGIVDAVGWAMLALSVIHATVWSRRQPTGLVPPGFPTEGGQSRLGDDPWS